MGMFGDKETTTKTEPWKEQQPYLEEIFREAQRLYGGGMPDQRLAGFNVNELWAQQNMLNWAKGAGTDMANQAQGSLGFLLSGDVLRPESNPYLAARAAWAGHPGCQG